MIPALLFCLNEVSSTCRVNFADLDWVETRTPPPYTGTEPLTSIRVEVCAAVRYDFRFESRLTVGGAEDADFINHGARLLVEVDVEGKWVELLQFAYAVPNYVETNPMPPYDGVLDFAGASGFTVTRSLQQLAIQDIDITDEAFWRAPFTLRVSAFDLRPGDLGPGVPVNRVVGYGAYTAEAEGQASAAVVLMWNGRKP